MPEKTQFGLEDPYRTPVYKNYAESTESTPDFSGKKARKEELPQHEYFFVNIAFKGNLVPMCSDANRVNSFLGFGDLRSTLLYGIYGNFFDCGVVSGTHQRQLQKMKNQLFEEIVGQTSLDSIPFVKELPQMVQTCVGALQRIGDIYKGLTRGQPDKVADVLLSGQPTRRFLAVKRFRDAGLSRRAADGLSNQWLEAQYGILPAMNDVKNAGRLMDKTLVPPERAITAEAYHPFWNVIKCFRQNEVDPNWSKTTADGKIRSVYKATAVYTVDSPWQAAFQSLGLDVPLAGLYECIPFSFVLDWFVPVGNWLKSGRSIQGKTLTRGWHSEKHQGFSVTTHKYCASPTAVGTNHHLTKYRNGLGGFPLYWETDLWDPSLSVGRFFNALALGQQQISKRL